MAQKDIISKRIIKRLIEDISKYLFELELESIEVLETQYQRIEERRADIVVRVEDSIREYLMHIEIQNDNDLSIPNRMLRYRTDIALQWPAQTIEQYLIYIGKARLNMPDGIDDKGLNYRYHLIDMHQIDCEYFLQQHDPDALIIAILCDFKGRDEREVIHYIIGELKRYHKNNEKGFRDSMAMLEILSSNRNFSVDIREEEQMLSMRIDELPSYDIGYEKGIEKGIEQGIEKGEIKGEIKGKIEGEIKGKIEVVIKMLNVFSNQQISEYTGLSIKDIESIRQKHSK